MAAAARLLKAGYVRTYCASARAIHSHDYTLREEFTRYFDIGVLLRRDPVLCDARLAASGEGLMLLRAELKYAVAAGGPTAAFGVLAPSAGKLIGFQLGLHYLLIPRPPRRPFSMHAFFWD